MACLHENVFPLTVQWIGPLYEVADDPLMVPVTTLPFCSRTATNERLEPVDPTAV